MQIQNPQLYSDDFWQVHSQVLYLYEYNPSQLIFKTLSSAPNKHEHTQPQ